MTCDTFRDQAFDYLQGDLRDASAFEAHRASCAACAAALQGIRENDRILSAARVPTAPADLWPRIAAAIGRDREIPFRRMRIASLAAAAAALLLAVTLFATMRSSRPAPTINLVVQEVGPESHRTFKALVPRYEDVDAATAMVDTMFRNDY
jgi:anti-sigma factor RsiW